MRIFHFNDEEKQLHKYLLANGHTNVIVDGQFDPFEAVEQESFDAAFVGLHPHGLQLIKALQAHNPNCFVTIITSDEDTRMAVAAMKQGAFDYLLSPLNFSEVERTHIMLAREHDMLLQHRRLESELAAAVGGGKLIGRSEAIRKLRRLIEKAASSSAPVLITGETGTGKELVARLLHEQSERSHHAMVSINCNAIPSALLESELFGYSKGAFTGADKDREGLLLSSSGGTFFFDEIADLEFTLQGKLLRVLQQEEVMPLGTTKPLPLNTRFVAATNCELATRVKEDRFREDLYYRLNVIPIYVPPLRERPEDIDVMCRYFLNKYAERETKPPLQVTSEVWRWLSDYHWPGNVRELENVCQRAVALAENNTFDADVLDLSDRFVSVSPGSESGGEASLGSRPAREERQLLEQALTSHQGVVARAARSLGISRTTFYSKAKKLGIRLR